MISFISIYLTKRQIDLQVKLYVQTTPLHIYINVFCDSTILINSR